MEATQLQSWPAPPCTRHRTCTSFSPGCRKSTCSLQAKSSFAVEIFNVLAADGRVKIFLKADYLATLRIWRFMLTGKALCCLSVGPSRGFSLGPPPLSISTTKCCRFLLGVHISLGYLEEPEDHADWEGAIAYFQCTAELRLYLLQLGPLYSLLCLTPPPPSDHLYMPHC